MAGPVLPPRPPLRGDVTGWTAAIVLGGLALIPLTTAWTLAEDLGHGWAVPVLAAYLWWERWDERPTGVSRERLGLRWWLAAALLALLALVLRLPLTPYPLWPTPLACYTLVLAAVALGGAWLAAGGAGVRWVGGPLLLLFAAVPWPTVVELNLIGPMREVLAAVAAEVCYFFGVSALAAGTTIRLANNWVGVDETCGGMRSLQACVMAALFLGEWLRLAWPRRVGLVAVGIGAAILGNFLRIVLLVWRASVGGESALAAAHDIAGWLALVTSLGLTTAVAWRLRGRPPVAAEVPSAPATRIPLPCVAMVWVATLAGAGLVAELGTRGWYWRGHLHQAATVPQWAVRFPDHGPGFRPALLSDPAREMLRPDFWAAGDWQDDLHRPVSAYYIEWRRRQAAHNPTVCLQMSGCKLLHSVGTISVRWAGGEIPFEVHRLRRGGEEFVVGFVVWDPAAGRPLAGESGGWRALMTARLRRIREARADEPAQLLVVAVWGERPEEQLAATIPALIVRRP